MVKTFIRNGRIISDSAFKRARKSGLTIKHALDFAQIGIIKKRRK